MTTSAQILIKAPVSLDYLAGEVMVDLGLGLDKIETERGSKYQYEDTRTYLELKRNSYVNDADLPFEQYEYVIEILSANLPSEDDDVRWTNEVARPLYGELVASRRYCLMLVRDLQWKLDEFCP